MDIFDALLALAFEHLPQPWHGVGQSTGGAILLKHLLEEKSGASLFSRVALLAPLLHPRHWPGNRLVYFFAHRFLNICLAFIISGCQSFNIMSELNS